MSGNYYGVYLDRDHDDEWEELENFIKEGYPVILASAFDDAADILGIDEDDIEIVERTYDGDEDF